MTGLTESLEALAEVVDLSAGRIPPETEAKARSLLTHAPRRLTAGPQTVVALAGATGSGKSSLLNALAETSLAEQGARRPTTSTPLAVSFSATNTDLLDLIGVQRRYEAQPPADGLSDLVLLDMPDHDSTLVSHRDEVDRLVGLVDQFVWVLDPQKYADAAVHRRYLQPLAPHREVITVLLNQSDRLNQEQLTQCLAHLRRLLDADGLDGVTLLPVSALSGQGIDELRSRLADMARGKRAASARLAADIGLVAKELDEHIGPVVRQQVRNGAEQHLTDRLAAAAGVEIVVGAVRSSLRQRGHQATGCPMVTWLSALRPDPLKRLQLGGARTSSPAEADGQHELVRSSLMRRSSAAPAELSTGLRAVAASVGEELPPLWRAAVTRAVHDADHRLIDALDRAVVTTDLQVDREPAWWRVIGSIQWILIWVVVVAVLWLVLNVLLGYLGLPPIDGGMRPPLPTLLLIGGLLGGVGVSAASQGIVRYTANRAATRAGEALRASVAKVAREQVLAPVEAEVRRHCDARAALDRLR